MTKQYTEQYAEQYTEQYTEQTFADSCLRDSSGPHIFSNLEYIDL